MIYTSVTPKEVHLVRDFLFRHRKEFDPPLDMKNIGSEIKELRKILFIKRFLGISDAILCKDETQKILGYIRFGLSDFLYDKRISPNPLHGYIFLILVDKKSRMRGVASNLFKMATIRMRKWQYPNLYYIQRKGNLAMIKIANKFQFSKVAQYRSSSRSREKQTIVWKKEIEQFRNFNFKKFLHHLRIQIILVFKNIKKYLKLFPLRNK